MGMDLVACEAARPLVVPGWTTELSPAVEAGSRLAAHLEHHESTSLVLLCHDQVFAAAVAAQASRAREREAGCWLCPYPTDPSSDPFPMLIWANDAAGRDTVLVAATDDSIYDVPSLREARTGLDLRRRHTSSTLYVVQRTLDPDPLDLRSTLPVLDLEPLWIGQAAPAIRRALESSAKRDLDAQLDGRILRSVSTRNADLGIRMMALHREVLGDVAAKAIPDLVNREARISACMALGTVDDEETEPAPEIPDTDIDHLVLDEATRTVFDNILQRARAGKRCVVVVSGPPGVGKSLSARCLAGSLGRPVAEARASELRGKYYGEEERGLQQLFEQAEQRNEVLVFDEADEWVGRREGSSAGESGARIMESSEMLLNLERFNGVAVLTTNRVEVLDPALHRRVDVWLPLRIPGPDERMSLWASALAEQIEIDPTLLVTLSSVPLSGGDIEACVAQVEATTGILSAQSLMDAVRARAEMRALLG
jgi:AAA+ superfamily predicted ATPase